MEEQIRNAMKFYLLATKLKYKIRSGWDKKHWNINSDRIESIAEHVYGTCILAISLNSKFHLNMDMEKVLTMITIHEIGEVLIGDNTPFDKTTQKDKEELEPNTKNIDINIIIVGNLPLQGTKTLVKIAISRSLLESIILAPVTPTALQPNPIAIVNACLPHEEHF